MNIYTKFSIDNFFYDFGLRLKIWAKNNEKKIKTETSDYFIIHVELNTVKKILQELLINFENGFGFKKYMKNLKKIEKPIFDHNKIIEDISKYLFMEKKCPWLEIGLEKNLRISGQPCCVIRNITCISKNVIKNVIIVFQIDKMFYPEPYYKKL